MGRWGVLGLCPKCKQNSVFYDPHLKIALCCYKSCGFKEKVSDERSYFEAFEKNTEDHARKVPSYDLSFVFLRKIVDAYRLNGRTKPTYSFYFFLSHGKYTGESATSLEEFADKIEKINTKSLEFHFCRGDFERWVAETLGDTELAKQINNLSKQNPVGETLRSQLYDVVSNRLMETKAKLPIVS